MILIVDSGSTKCDWIVIDNNGNQAAEKIRTKGLNPAIIQEKKLRKTIKKSKELRSVSDDVTHVFFYGAGCGIVWDSDAAAELAELQLKTQVLATESSSFRLIETMRATPDGVFLLDGHLTRLQSSADYFGFACDLRLIKTELSALQVMAVLVEQSQTTVIAEKVKVLSAERSVTPVEGSEAPSVPSTITLLVTVVPAALTFTKYTPLFHSETLKVDFNSVNSCCNNFFPKTS